MKRRAYCCDASRELYEEYYSRQNGGEIPVFAGRRFQRGHGLGSMPCHAGCRPATIAVPQHVVTRLQASESIPTQKKGNGLQGGQVHCTDAAASRGIK